MASPTDANSSFRFFISPASPFPRLRPALWFYHSRMPMISHLWPWKRWTNRMVRSTQSTIMAIQMATTPKR